MSQAVGNIPRQVLGRQVRTSLTDPLRIAEVTAGQALGLIGITFCPGKAGSSLSGIDWARDLDVDLDAIKVWRADAVVTLIEDHEFALLSVIHLGEQVRARGMAWHHLPITDVQPPDARFESGWCGSGPALADVVRNGGRVLVHCRGGLGRAGTVAACLLIELGLSAQDVVERIRRARPGAIETRQQLAYVNDFGNQPTIIGKRGGNENGLV